MPEVINSHCNPTDFPSLETFPLYSCLPTGYSPHPVIRLGEAAGFQSIHPRSVQICWWEAVCLPLSKTTAPREEPWMHGLFLSSPSSRQSGNVLSGLLCWCKAQLWSRSRLEGREGIWGRETYGGVVFAGGKLVVKIRKVKITGRGREA